MKDTLRPRGRLAHSAENRVGQAWRSGSVQVMGEDIFGQVKVFRYLLAIFYVENVKRL